MSEQWSNWSGSVKGRPDTVARPQSLNDLIQLVKRCASTDKHIRVVGAGHSFVPLVETEDMLISLDNLQGIVSIDRNAGTVTVWGGTRLKLLGDALFEHGLAQENLGDIDSQSIAGAISTGTHGTGTRFGTLSTQVAGLTLVTATGEVLECSPDNNPEIPARRMHYQGMRKKLDDCLDNLDDYKQNNSHFEFFWFPYTDGVQAKFLNESSAPVSKSTLWGQFNSIVLENGVYWLLSEACRLVPRLCKAICHISAQAIANVDVTNYSHRLFTTPRLVRFQEMEYNIPAHHLPDVINAIRQCIDQQQFRVHFPVECRFVRSDDIWLSPAYQRDSAYVAVHMYRGMPYRAYFQQIEAIFKRYDGRPHWGKMHTRTAEELAALYPHWQDFRRVRAMLDPAGLFLNSYLRAIFDTDSAAEHASSPINAAQESL
jgi:FAD/FMN-containing dehydrogenase